MWPFGNSPLGTSPTLDWLKIAAAGMVVGAGFFLWKMLANRKARPFKPLDVQPAKTLPDLEWPSKMPTL